MTDNIQNISLFHGNPDFDFIPKFGCGRDYHDYGNAFYCTPSFDSAAEWACLRKTEQTAYVYEYKLSVPIDISPEVRILDFDKLDAVYWISALLQHRYDDELRPELLDRREEFIKKYPTNCDKFDIIYGWRADDKFFALVRDFLNALITLETAKEAILLGDLGKQLVVKSERAYSWIKNVNKSELSSDDYKKWHGIFNKKDQDGRSAYSELVDDARKSAKEQKKRGTLILDLI